MGGAVVVGIFYWDGSLAILVLPRRRPMPNFAVSWVDSALAKVGTLIFFH